MEKRTIVQIIGLLLITIFIVDVVGTTTMSWNEHSDRRYLIFEYPDGDKQLILKLSSTS